MSPPDGLPAVPGPLRAPPVAGWPDGAVRVTHPLRSLGVTPAPRYSEVVRPSPAHWYFRPRGSSAWVFSLGSTGQTLPFCPEAQAGVISPVRRTPPGQSTGSRQAAPRAYPRPWFWRRRCPFDASPGIRLRSSPQPPPDGCSRLFPDAHHHGFWPQQLRVVWSLCLYSGSEGPPFISCPADTPWCFVTQHLPYSLVTQKVPDSFWLLTS